MYGFILGIFVGGFIGFFTMALCVISRDNKAVKEMDEFEEDSL